MEMFEKPKSNAIEEIARDVIPAAMMSNFRRHPLFKPIYMTDAYGARLVDVDGNEYIDYCLCYGPTILGHGNKRLQEAIIRQTNRLYGPFPTELEVSAAEKINQHIASADLVRFVCTGTGANWGALRVARAFTKKQMYVRFNGHYHGGLDHLLGGIIQNGENPVPVDGELEEDTYSQMTKTAGRYIDALKQVYMIEWNDLNALEKLFTRYGDNIAAIIMEPVMVNNGGCTPEPGYLEGARELCTNHNVLLIFDEVLTGFRIDLRGAQGFFGITPDITTLGKAIAGGFPASAFCGKREIMDSITNFDVVHGGTFNGHPVAMAAIVATIGELENGQGEAFRHIRKMGTMLKEGLEAIAKDHDQPLLLQGFPGAWTCLFTHKEKVINHADSLDADDVKLHHFIDLMKRYGVIMTNRLCTSAAHTEKDVGDALDRANEAMKQLKRMG